MVRSLPRNVTRRHLYRFTVDEDIFVAAEMHFSTLLNHPNVDGVYEMQVPLDVRALIKLGACCAVDAKSRRKFSRALDSGFDMDDLVQSKHPTIERHSYLSGGTGIRYVYIWHGSKDARHVIGLFADGKLTVHVVETAGIRQLPALEPMYKERIARWTETGRLGKGVFSYREEMDIELRLHTTPARAWKAVAKELAGIKRESQSPTMLALCTAHKQAYYETALGPAVLGDFPVLIIPAAHLDNNFPSLGWQLYGVKRMLNCYFRTASWILEWIKVASQFDLPICNIRGDVTLFAADIDYARRLTRSDMLLWWSERAGGPDLGGLQLDGNFVDPNQRPTSLFEISRPGSYSNVVFEVSVGDLAMNALLQSASINDMEGSQAAGSTAFDNTSHNLDEYSRGSVQDSTSSVGASVVTSQVFWTLKGMVKSWYVEKVRGKSAYSPALANGFWRWLSSERSCLFEPAVENFMAELMKKTLLQLLGECKRLGASVVHATFQRIFLLTSKPTAGSAAAYGRYLVSALTARDLFKHLNLDIVHHWEYLLWMDSANFGGVICRNAEEVFANEDEYRAKAFQVDMHWNIATFLPPNLQPRFALIVGGFLKRLYESKRKSASTRLADRTPLMVVQGKADSATTDEGKVAVLESQDTQTAKALLSRWVTRKMLLEVQEIKDLDSAGHHNWQWPGLPGRNYDIHGASAGLEFVKTTMAVLSLHREASVEVGICRRNLLDVLGVGEFSAEAEFANPCESLLVQGVICAFCNDDRVLDMCRDADLLLHRKEEWKCTKCQCPYDTSDVEMRVCAMATEAVAAFCLQDLRCNKCDRLKEGNVALHCPCSGSWGLTVTRKETRAKLETMQRVAKFHRLMILQEAVSELLEEC